MRPRSGTFAQRFMADAYGIPVVDKHVTEAAKTVVLLEAIDSGRLDDAKHSLRLQLDGQILTVDALLDSADERSQELARKVFTRVARYLAEHPADYSGQTIKPDPDVTAKVDSILKRATGYSK